MRELWRLLMPLLSLRVLSVFFGLLAELLRHFGAKQDKRCALEAVVVSSDCRPVGDTVFYALKSTKPLPSYQMVEDGWVQIPQRGCQIKRLNAICPRILWYLCGMYVHRCMSLDV